MTKFPKSNFLRLHYFVPPETTSPDWRTTYLANILQRAHAMLERRNAREIQFMLDSISYLLWHGLPDLLGGKPRRGSVNMNPAVILRDQMARVDIDDQIDVPDARWPEYFAALTIALCEKAFVEEREHLDPEPHVEAVDPPELWLDRELLCHATEAMATAEALQSGNVSAVAVGSLQSRIKLSAKKASIARWAPSREIKDLFVMEFRKGMFGDDSVRDAAGRFFAKLSETDKRILCPSLIPQNAERSLVAYYNRAGQ